MWVFRGIARRRAAVSILCIAAIVGCTPARSATTGPSTEGITSEPVSQARVLHLLSRDEPAGMSVRLDRNGQGFPLTVPLLYRDDKHVVRGMLAERVPNQSDGSWVVNPDGTMKTVYTLKPDLKWQDGKPHTAHDFVFTWQVYMWNLWEWSWS